MRLCRLASRTRQLAINLLVLFDANSIPKPFFKFVVGLFYTPVGRGLLESTEVVCAGLADFGASKDNGGNELFPLVESGMQVLLCPIMEYCG